jgi:hypothetical protein
MDAQKYGYLTVGGTVCTCIRFCTQTDMFPLPPLKFGTAIEGRQGKLVQKMKAHASESGQMHAQHIAICGQVTKKKYALCLGPNVSAGNGPRWRFRTRQAAAKFFIFYAQIWPLFPSFKMAFQGYTR